MVSTDTSRRSAEYLYFCNSVVLMPVTFDMVFRSSAVCPALTVNPASAKSTAPATIDRPLKDSPAFVVAFPKSAIFCDACPSVDVDASSFRISLLKDFCFASAIAISLSSSRYSALVSLSPLDFISSRAFFKSSTSFLLFDVDSFRSAIFCLSKLTFLGSNFNAVFIYPSSLSSPFASPLIWLIAFES